MKMIENCEIIGDSVSLFSKKRHSIENLRLNIEDDVYINEEDIRILNHIYK